MWEEGLLGHREGEGGRITEAFEGCCQGSDIVSRTDPTLPVFSPSSPHLPVSAHSPSHSDPMAWAPRDVLSL